MAINTFTVTSAASVGEVDTFYADVAAAYGEALGWEVDGTKILHPKSNFYFKIGGGYANGDYQRIANLGIGNGNCEMWGTSANGSMSPMSYPSTFVAIAFNTSVANISNLFSYVVTDYTVAIGACTNVSGTQSSAALGGCITTNANGDYVGYMWTSNVNSTPIMWHYFLNTDSSSATTSTEIRSFTTGSFLGDTSYGAASFMRMPDPLNGSVFNDLYYTLYTPTAGYGVTYSIGGKSFHRIGYAKSYSLAVAEQAVADIFG